MSMTLSVDEAQRKLSQLMEMARSGQEVIIEDPLNGKAKLVPVSNPATNKQRVFGLHKGEVWMSDDFNVPLPDAFWLNDK